MSRRKSLIPGFSWRRALGITSAKQRIARATGIPTTKAGRRRKAQQHLWTAVAAGTATALGGNTARGKTPAQQSDTDYYDQYRRANPAKQILLVLVCAAIILCFAIGVGRQVFKALAPSKSADSSQTVKQSVSDAASTDSAKTVTDQSDESTPIVLPVPAEDAAEASAEATHDYVLNTSSKKFHLKSCGAVSQISAQNRDDRTATRDELIAEGYTPCGRCTP